MFNRRYKIKQGQIKEYENLLTIIEKLRCDLNRLGSVKKLTDPELLKLSRRLDMLINLCIRFSFCGSERRYRCGVPRLKEVN